jgi:hypothetical protein
MKRFLGVFALIVGAAFFGVFAYGLITLLLEEGLFHAPGVVLANWPSLLLRSAILLVLAVAFAVGGLHILASKRA